MQEIIKDCTVVITTFFAGNKLEDCIKKIPNCFKILIIDNGGEKEKKNYYENKFSNLTYYVSAENLGVPRSYSLANKIVTTKYMFNTQPDVIIKKNCIETLLSNTKKYPNFAILSPTIFHNNLYLHEGDYRILKIKNKKYVHHGKLKIHSAYNKPPDGDLSVDAVTGTAMLIDRTKLKLINDWDTNIFNYFEDMDLCLRLRLEGFEIIKIRDAEVDHDPFSSHDKNFSMEMDFSRNWHYSWSNFYFLKKHTSNFSAFKFGISLFFISTIKFILYFFFNKKKSATYFYKAYGIFFSMLNLKPNYRPKI